MAIQLGRKRDKHRSRNIPTRPAPSCLNSSIPKQGTLRICRAENEARGTARLGAPGLGG
jgi:hypothetical protein